MAERFNSTLRIYKIIDFDAAQRSQATIPVLEYRECSFVGSAGIVKELSLCLHAFQFDLIIVAYLITNRTHLVAWQNLKDTTF